MEVDNKGGGGGAVADGGGGVGRGVGLLNLIILQLDNDTYRASIQSGGGIGGVGNNTSQLHILNSMLQQQQQQHETYDGQGALYYVVAVLCMYAFSIILMIGSSIKKSKQDVGVNKYMKGMDKLRKIERRQQKFR